MQKDLTAVRRNLAGNGTSRLHGRRWRLLVDMRSGTDSSFRKFRRDTMFGTFLPCNLWQRES